jgi:hypothetical protein
MVSKSHSGVIIKIRMKRVVNAGLVVADVGVRWVERKSVSRRNGSSKRLHRVVNSRSVSTISSRVLWCFRVDSESSLLCPFGSCLSPVVDVEDRGEYLLEYMPKMSKTTTIIGPAYLSMSPPYNVTPQNVATSKKDSHGSLVLHDNSPASLFSGSRNGCEYARARVIWGGVATSKGDFLCTMMVERCFATEEEPDNVFGEKAAIVGGLGS